MFFCDWCLENENFESERKFVKGKAGKKSMAEAMLKSEVYVFVIKIKSPEPG